MKVVTHYGEGPPVDLGPADRFAEADRERMEWLNKRCNRDLDLLRELREQAKARGVTTFGRRDLSRTHAARPEGRKTYCGLDVRDTIEVGATVPALLSRHPTCFKCARRLRDSMRGASVRGPGGKP